MNKTISFLNEPSCFHDLAGFRKPDGSIATTPADPLYTQYSDYTVGVRGTITGYFFDIGNLSYWSYATMHQPVADYYVMHVLIP